MAFPGLGELTHLLGEQDNSVMNVSRESRHLLHAWCGPIAGYWSIHVWVNSVLIRVKE